MTPGIVVTISAACPAPGIGVIRAVTIRAGARTGSPAAARWLPPALPARFAGLRARLALERA